MAPRIGVDVEKITVKQTVIIDQSHAILSFTVEGAGKKDHFPI